MMRYTQQVRKDTAMQEVKNKTSIIYALKIAIVITLCIGCISACTRKDSAKSKLSFVNTFKEPFVEQVVYDETPSISYIRVNPDKQSAFKLVVQFNDNYNNIYGFSKLRPNLSLQINDMHLINSKEGIIDAFWDGHRFLFIETEPPSNNNNYSGKVGISDNKQKLWTSKDIKALAMFRGKDERLYTVSIEFPEFYSYATQKLVIRNAHDGTEVRSLILQTHDDNAPDRSVSLNLDQGGHLEEIAVYTSNLKIYYGIDENYADIYDENLQKLRRITETSNNVMHVLDWPTSKQKAYVFQASTITVKNAQNQVVYKGDRLENTCVSSYHYDVETVQFQKGKSYLAVLSTGTYECHQVVLSILNDKAELVYQKEMPRFSSMSKIDIGDNQQGLLLAKKEGLTLMTLPLPSSNAQTPVH